MFEKNVGLNRVEFLSRLNISYLRFKDVAKDILKYADVTNTRVVLQNRNVICDRLGKYKLISFLFGEDGLIVFAVRV